MSSDNLEMTNYTLLSVVSVMWLFWKLEPNQSYLWNRTSNSVCWLILRST